MGLPKTINNVFEFSFPRGALWEGALWEGALWVLPKQVTWPQLGPFLYQRVPD